MLLLPLLAAVLVAEDSAARGLLAVRLGLPPPKTEFRSKKGTMDRVQWSIPGGSTVIFSTGSAAAVRRAVSAEYVMVLKSITHDRTLAAAWTVPVDTFYADTGIRLTDRAVLLDFIRVPPSTREAGLGAALVNDVVAEARRIGARVILLVAKQFAREPSPVAFWRSQGFSVIVDPEETGPVAMGRGRPVAVDEVVLMGRVLLG